MLKFKLLFLLMTCCAITNALSQVEDSDASVSYSMSSSKTRMISSKRIIAEDFINYHRPDIPLPSGNEEVCMSLKWGNPIVSKKGEALLQIGFTTANIKDFSKMPVANITFVVDKSGSMSTDMRLERVKEAIVAVVNKLRPVDYISVVVYDDNAIVLVNNCLIGNDKERIINEIKTIKIGGSTNINDGMMLGYKENMKNIQKNGTNRVILLTDGVFNVGETDPDKILANSTTYNQKGIEVSTIGIGNDVNFEILYQLAKNGKGLSHFIGEADNFQKVFVDEVESLICGIGKDVDLTINLDNSLELEKIYGYQPVIEKNSVKLKMDNMNAGLTRLCLLKFKTGKDFSGAGKEIKVTASLNYSSSQLDKRQNITKEIELKFDESKTGINFITDQDIRKNYAIANLAMSLKDALETYENNDKNRTIQILKAAINDVDERFPFLEDPDIIRVRDILVDQLGILLGNANLSDNNGTKQIQYTGYSEKPDKSDVDINIPQAKAEKNNTYAIIIGNEDYSSYQLGLKDEANAKYASNDAYTFREYVHQAMGVPEKQIRYLKNATAGQIKQALDWINNLSKIDNGEAELIFYYSGHGLPNQLTKEPYLVPVDVDGEKLEFAVKLDDVYSKLSEHKAKRITVVLDACFSGGARNYPLLSNKSVVIKAKDVPVKNNMVIFCSSSGTESSNILEDKYHGLYTYYLLKKLQETNANISYKELADYLTKTIAKESALKGKSQTPTVIVADEAKGKWEKWTID